MLSHHITPAQDPRFILQVHGGAWDIPASLKAAHIAGVQKAHDVAAGALASRQPPLQAVIEALKVMEDDPVFDAGRGSSLNEDGEVELDAAVMEGGSLRAGAVAAVSRFPHPCELALAVMERTNHVLLIREGAERFALAQGFAPVDPATLVDPREFESYRAWVAAGKPDARLFFDAEGRVNPGQDPIEHEKRGTVGIVLGVRDRADGPFRLFAGISTGGTRAKMAGRVGDAPLVGCGLYADDEGGAVCCTGWGEGFIRMAAAKGVSD
ncbi:MAG TPA: isoaspartyl peptidase/L-asparaginase, partial [Holophaga sp.]|nr:isoaspartyl peptidase/L-asparaginase [Holophaga sp.]